MVSPTYQFRLSQHALDLDAAGHHALGWTSPCRAATTANITISTALNNGDTLDGVTLATGDRVLVKDQSTGSQNGIYIVGPSPTRAEDYDTSAQIVGSVVVASEGTTNADTAWKCTTNAPITVGTTALVFATFGGAGGGTPTLEDVLLAGNDPAGNRIENTLGAQGATAFILIDEDPGDGSGAAIQVLAGTGDETFDGGWLDLAAGGGDYDGVDLAGSAGVFMEGGYGDGTGGAQFVYSGSAGPTTDADGGDLYLTPGPGDGTGRDGQLIIENLPTADPTITDAVWLDGGVLVMSGSTAGGGGGPTFVDSEVPAGTINGVNAAFTLASAPGTTLHLYKNGLRQRAGSGNDYTLSGSTITYEAGNLPQTGDSHLADYRT